MGLFGNVDVCCVVVLVLIAAEHADCVRQPSLPQQTGAARGHTNAGLIAPVVRFLLHPRQLFGSEKTLVSHPVEDPGGRHES